MVVVAVTVVAVAVVALVVNSIFRANPSLTQPSFFFLFQLDRRRIVPAARRPALRAHALVVLVIVVVVVAVVVVEVIEVVAVVAAVVMALVVTSMYRANPFLSQACLPFSARSTANFIDSEAPCAPRSCSSSSSYSSSSSGGGGGRSYRSSGSSSCSNGPCCYQHVPVSDASTPSFFVIPARSTANFIDSEAPYDPRSCSRACSNGHWCYLLSGPVHIAGGEYHS